MIPRLLPSISNSSARSLHIFIKGIGIVVAESEGDSHDGGDRVGFGTGSEEGASEISVVNSFDSIWFICYFSFLVVGFFFILVMLESFTISFLTDESLTVFIIIPMSLVMMGSPSSANFSGVSCNE